MSKNENPFAIRKSPVEIISAQALPVGDKVDEYLQKMYLKCDSVLAGCGMDAENPIC